MQFILPPIYVSIKYFLPRVFAEVHKMLRRMIGELIKTKNENGLKFVVP
jgi:hypothetical protein